MTCIEDTIVAQYCAALESFRKGDARPFEHYLAAVLDATSLLVDPGEAVLLGEDPDAATVYHDVNADVWDRLCAAARAGSLSEQHVVQVIREEYGFEFGSEYATHEDGTVTLLREGTSKDAPEGTKDFAALVWLKLEFAEPFAGVRTLLSN